MNSSRVCGSSVGKSRSSSPVELRADLLLRYPRRRRDEGGEHRPRAEPLAQGRVRDDDVAEELTAVLVGAAHGQTHGLPLGVAQLQRRPDVQRVLLREVDLEHRVLGAERPQRPVRALETQSSCTTFVARAGSRPARLTSAPDGSLPSPDADVRRGADAGQLRGGGRDRLGREPRCVEDHESAR